MTYDDIDKKEQEPLVIKDQSAIKDETKPVHTPLVYEGKEPRKPSNAATQSSDQTSTFQQSFETRQRVDVAHQSRIIQRGVQGTQNLAETAGEAIVHSVTGSQEETEESQRAKRQISDIAETIDASATHGIAADHIRNLRNEANRYIAADMFFDNNGSTYNKVAAYYNDLGFTCGISKTYDAVAKNPDRFYKGDGTLNFDEEKIIAYVKSHEKYAESDLNHENPLKIENKKFRKKEEKMQAYVRINEIEADMRQHLEIFNREERELLKPENNNRMFDFRSVKDVNRAESMINKIIIQDVRDLKLSGLDFEDKAIFRGQFDLNKLNRMSSKETKALIDNLQKLLVNPDLDDIKRIGIQSLLKKLDGRMLLTCTSEKLRKLNLRSAGHGVFRLMGGDELASSDVGQGLRQTQQVYRVGKFAATAGVHGVALTGKAIINIEALRKDTIFDALDDVAQVIICDEIHKAKNGRSKQGYALRCLKAPYKIGLTGTPVDNKVEDLYNILAWLGEENRSFVDFRDAYCILDKWGSIVDYTNLGNLQEKLNKVMICRKKSDVVDLPEKIYKTEYVELSKAEEKKYKELRDGILNDIDRLIDMNNPLSNIFHLREVTGGLYTEDSENAKLARIKEIIEEEIIPADKKAIVFSKYEKIAEIYKRQLTEYHPAYMTGSVSPEERQKEVERFQTDPDCKICIGTIGAMGTGITLTAASTVIFADKDWTVSANRQAEDRAHRIGTTENVNVITVVAKDTIDEYVEGILKDKELYTDLIMEGTDVVMDKTKRPQLIADLLGISEAELKKRVAKVKKARAEAEKAKAESNDTAA